jgi:hypothetical protein
MEVAVRLAVAAVTLLLLTGVAYAQAPVINLWGEDSKGRDPEKAQKQDEIDRAYKEKTKNQAVPAQPASNDPWGTVRSNEKPAAQGKTQGTKTR